MTTHLYSSLSFCPFALLRWTDATNEADVERPVDASTATASEAGLHGHYSPNVASRRPWWLSSLVPASPHYNLLLSLRGQMRSHGKVDHSADEPTEWSDRGQKTQQPNHADVSQLAGKVDKQPSKSGILEPFAISLNSALPEVHTMPWSRRKTASRIWNPWRSKTLPSSMPSLRRRASREPALGKAPNCANPSPTDSSVGICKYVDTSSSDCSEKIKKLGVKTSTLGRMVRFTGRHHVYDNEESPNKSQSDFTDSTGDSFHEIWPDRRGDGQSTLPRKGKSGSTSAFRTALGFGSREPVKAASQDLQPHGQHSQLAVDPTSARRRHYANLLRFLPGVYEDRGEILSKVIYQNFSFIGVVFFRNVKW